MTTVLEFIYVVIFLCYVEFSGKNYIGVQRELDIQSHLKITLRENIGFLKWLQFTEKYCIGRAKGRWRFGLHFVVWEGQKKSIIRNPCSLVIFSEVVKSYDWFQRSNDDRVGIEIIARFVFVFVCFLIYRWQLTNILPKT